MVRVGGSAANDGTHRMARRARNTPNSSHVMVLASASLHVARHSSIRINTTSTAPPPCHLNVRLRPIHKEDNVLHFRMGAQVGYDAPFLHELHEALVLHAPCGSGLIAHTV